jgi:hypothetical protein
MTPASHALKIVYIAKIKKHAIAVLMGLANIKELASQTISNA